MVVLILECIHLRESISEYVYIMFININAISIYVLQAADLCVSLALALHYSRYESCFSFFLQTSMNA